MNSQQYCLRWNNYQSNLTNVFDQLLQNEAFVDVTLACEGHSLKCHKMVLSACSPYFQSLLFDNPCQHPIVILKDVRFTELKPLVEFMYKGEINVCQDQIPLLLKVAETLKIRGLAEVRGDNEDERSETKSSTAWTPVTPSIEISGHNSPAHKRKRRRLSGQDNRLTTDLAHPNVSESFEAPPELSATGLTPVTTPRNVPSIVGTEFPALPRTSHPTPNPTPTSTPTPSHTPSSLPDQRPTEESDIKPGIAELIREEERAKMIENVKLFENSQLFDTSAINNSIAWPSLHNPIAESYQYQMQNLWQRAWNQNHSLLQSWRFRERGPLKSWKPETMALAIRAVLNEGLSLSQAARKYDIPYPTFVLYANRVHNMLGPSSSGSAELRPKGRGRPQRILLGNWTEAQIANVIKTVVFRDSASSSNQATESTSPTEVMSESSPAPLPMDTARSNLEEAAVPEDPIRESSETYVDNSGCSVETITPNPVPRTLENDMDFDLTALEQRATGTHFEPLTQNKKDMIEGLDLTSPLNLAKTTVMASAVKDWDSFEESQQNGETTPEDQQ